MSYTEKNLQLNEKVLKEASISWLITIANFISVVFFLLLMIIGFVVDKTFGIVCLILFFVSIFCLTKKIIIICTNELVITNKRVIIKHGIISRHIAEAPLEKIDNVSVTQDALARIFKYGSVKVETTSEPMCLKYVSNANEFKNSIVTIIDKKKEEAANAQSIRQAQEMARAMMAAKNINTDNIE